MRRKKAELSLSKGRVLERRYKPLVKRAFIALVCLLTLSSASGCSLLPPKHEEPPRASAGLKALDEYAWSCYERGLEYMDQSRYGRARRQFSFGASSAVSKTLYEDSLDGMHRAEQIINQQR